MSARPTWAVAAAFVAVVAATSGSGCAKIFGVDDSGKLSDGSVGQPCDTTSNNPTPCAVGVSCVLGLCRKACSGDRECADTERCLAGSSKDTGGAVYGCIPSNGAHCNGGPGCMQGNCICPPGASCGSDGQCRNLCNPDCPADETCVPSQNVCFGTPPHDMGGGLGPDGGSTGDGGDAGVRPAKLPEPLTNMAAVSDMGGRIIVVGGTNAQQVPSKAAYAYDPSTNTWSRLSDMPTARTALGAAQGSSIDQALYAIGGFDANGNGLTIVEVFNPLNNGWTTTASMPTARGAFACATLLGSGALVAGGAPSVNGGPLQTLEMGQNMGTRWMSQPNMPTAREWAAGADLQNGGSSGMLVLGGAPSQGTVELFSQNTNMWTTVNSMPTGRGHLAAVSGNNMMGHLVIYAVGGSNAGGVLSTFEAYDINNQAWSQLPPMPTPRQGLVVVALNNGPNSGLVAIGGDDGTMPVHPLDVVEIYSFQTNSWSH